MRVLLALVAAFVRRLRMTSITTLADAALETQHAALLKQYPARQTGDQPKNVQLAIRKHALVKGMTYGEAVAALGKPDIIIEPDPVLVAWHSTASGWHAEFDSGKIAAVTREDEQP